ncbi:MAG TPA: hypothetical protein HA254_05775 [Candidatus Diapherotrites archaeon]|uniref:Fibronectin type-III domain-containing protein n=1 Tax=Candidatus Iainarchaeum sp. TaxID=3101447 RepID=A0A7J4J182_9ARCH|nr:hypothetical protein [Candidatus Diapherotrites archaeon]
MIGSKNGVGSESSPILIGSYGSGPRPVISGAGLMRAVFLQNESYIVLRDIEMRDSSSYGEVLRVQDSNHIIVNNCIIHEAETAMVVYILRSSQIIVDNCNIYGNRGADDYGSVLVLEDSNSNTIRNSQVHDTSSRYGDVISVVKSSNNLIENNDIYGPAENGVYIRPNSNSNFIARNYIHDINGIGVQIRENSSHNRVQGNLLSNNDGPIMQSDGQNPAGSIVDGTEFSNNTIYNSKGKSGGVHIFGPGNRNIIFKSNIVAGSGAPHAILVSPDSSANTTLNNNIYYKAGGIGALVLYNGLTYTSADFNSYKDTSRQDTESFAQDPLFINTESPLGADGVLWTSDDGFRPRQSSPACGNGKGNTYIGAYGCVETIRDTIAPFPPIAVVAQALGYSMVSVKWSASIDNVAVSGYKVFRNGAEIATTSTISYLDYGLSPNTAYTYYVIAFDFAQNQSVASDTISATTLDAPPIPGGNVLRLSFNDGTGSIAVDSSGNRNNAVVNGASWSRGVIDGALSFDGLDDYVEVPNSSGIEMLSNSFSIEAWVRVSGFGTQNDGIVFYNDIWSSGYGLMRYSNTGIFQFCSKDSSKTNCVSQYSGGGFTPNIGQWYHLVGIKDAKETTEDIYFYVDGQLLLSRTGLPKTSIPAGSSLRIGSQKNRFYFRGDIDEIKIYDRPLSPQEVIALFRGVTASKCSIVKTGISAIYINVFGCPVPIAAKFDIKPDFNATDIIALTDLNLGISQFGKITWNNAVISLTETAFGGYDRLDLDAGLNISQSKLSLNQNNIPQLNLPATITLYNTSFNSPKILRDGIECISCQITSYDRNSKTITFSVPGF